MSEIKVYLKKNEISLWKKERIWYKWFAEIPKNYAKKMSKFTGKNETGPCFWGMDCKSPEEKGYEFIGILDEFQIKK